MTPRKKSGKATKKGKSKRQSGTSRTVKNVANNTKKLLRAPYKQSVRQVRTSPIVANMLKIASDSDDIEQLTLDAANRNLEASSNLSSMPNHEKLAAAEDVRNLLKRQTKDGAAVWISDFANSKRRKNKKDSTS